MARILIVEDNVVNMKLATMVLRIAGHTPLCAVDGETGIALARTDLPDLILMDIQLPGMNGLVATALLKDDPATASIPVIALSSMSEKSYQEMAASAGCDAYVVKPFLHAVLYAAIDTLLLKRGPEAAILAPG